MPIFDAVSPLERIKLSGALAAKVQELAGGATALQRIRLAREIGEILAQLGVASEAVAGGEPSAEPVDGLSDDPNSPNYRYRDTGYIADSRKEKAANLIKLAKESGQPVKATDIDWKAIESNPRQAAEIITKSNLFGQTDWAALQEAGMEPGAGFLIDRVYAAIAPQPDENSPRARADYALALQTIRERLEKCVTAQDVTDVLGEIKDELQGVQLNSEESAAYAELRAQADAITERMRALQQERDALSQAANVLNRQISALEWEQSKRTRRKWKPDPEIDAQIAALRGPRDEALAKVQAWDEAHPEFAEVWTTTRTEMGSDSTISSGLRDQRRAALAQLQLITDGAKARNLVENPVTRGWLTFGKRFFDLLNYRSYKGSDAFQSHVTNAKNGKIKDWSWAEKDRAPVKRATKQEIGFQLRVAERFERVGGRPVKVDSTFALKDMLGFRDVQSGNWVLKDPNSAKFHVEQTAAAMLDLSDVLGIDAQALGLGGRLGMAFGARGTGTAGWKQGAAKAHYESVHRVINLTKMGGGGSLGHEWGHALDDLLAELASGQASETKNNFGSDNPSVLPAGPLQDAMRAFRDVVLVGEHRLGEAIKVTDRDRKLARHNIDSPFNSIAKAIKAAGSLDAAVLAADGYFAGRTDKRSLKNKKQWRTLAAAYYAPEGEEVVRAKTGPAVSSFLYEAVRLDEGERNKYWSRMHEMFARAFQSYLEDKLAEQQRRNDYLSVYADNKYHFDPLLGIQWNPYPEGEERERINAAFDRLFDAIRGERVFENAMANKPLLDSIFGYEDHRPEIRALIEQLNGQVEDRQPLRDRLAYLLTQVEYADEDEEDALVEAAAQAMEIR